MRPFAVGLVVALGMSAAQGQAQTVPPGSELGIRGPAFFAVQVHDVERASSWYQEVFSLEVVNRLDADDGAYAIRILSGRDLTVELIQERRSEVPPERHFGHFKAGLYVVDIEAFHRRLLAAGVDVDSRIFADSALSVRSFVFRDVEGNRIQALQPFPNTIREPSEPYHVAGYAPDPRGQVGRDTRPDVFRMVAARIAFPGSACSATREVPPEVRADGDPWRGRSWDGPMCWLRW